jgi:uncharacterized RDD family membrane protein YckC
LLEMKCPKCGFVSFDDLNECKKCRTSLNPISGGNLKQTIEEKKAVKDKMYKNFFRPPDIDDTIEAIKKDLKDIEALSDRDTSHMFPYAQAEELQRIKYAGFFLRLTAFTIDVFILSVICMLLFVLGYYVVASLSTVQPNTFRILQTIFIPNIISIFILELAYFTYFHAVTGQTAGKWVCGIKVVSKTGSPLGFKIALLRYFSYILSFLCLNFGFIMIAFDGKKQGLHDKLAGSVVVKI